jgi:ankyrin repeat protein
METTTSLDLLPVECLTQICSFLDCHSLVRISTACKQFWFVANNDKIWKNLFKSDFKKFYVEDFSSDWKQQYRNRFLKSRFGGSKSCHLFTITSEALRERLLFDEDKDKTIDGIHRFKQADKWKEETVFEALHKEIQQLPPNTDKVALLLKFLLYLRQQNQKPFAEDYFDDLLFDVILRVHHSRGRGVASAMENLVQVLKLLLAHGANIFAQKSLAELTSQVALLRNVLTTRNPNVMITPRYLTCNETMDIVVEAEKKQKMILLTAFGKHSLQDLKHFLESIPNERYRSRPYWINATSAMWPSVDRQDIPPQWAPLHCAAARGDVEMLDFLLRLGAKISLRADDKTALDIAVEKRHASAVSLLENVWQRYLNLKKLTTDFLHHMFETRTDDYLAFEAHVKEVEHLSSLGDPYWLSYDIDVSVFFRFVSVTKGTLLHAIAEANLPRVLQTIVKQWPEWIKIMKITRRDIDGNSALHIAASNGHTEIVRLLLQQYARFMKHFHINRRNHLLLTPLELALSNGHLETARLLLEGGCHYQNLFVRSPHNNYFFNQGKLRECGELLKHYCRDHFPSVFKLMGSKALFFACLTKNYDFVKWIFDQLDNSYSKQEMEWFNINQHLDIPAHKKPTLLHIAAQGGDERIIRLLHQHGAQWCTDNFSQTPLHYAFIFENETAVRTLGELYGKDINDVEGLLKGNCHNFQSVLFDAINSPAVNWLSLLLFRANINPYTVRNEAGRNLIEEVSYRISNALRANDENAQKTVQILTSRKHEIVLVCDEVEKQYGCALQTALLRGDRQTAVQIFEFAKGLSKRRHILSVTSLLCFEAARHGILDVMFQYLEYFIPHERETVLIDIGLAAIEANLEQFFINDLLSFHSFPLNNVYTIFETWLMRCLQLRRRNLFVSMMKTSNNPQHEHCLTIALTQYGWSWLLSFAAKTGQTIEFEMLFQYGIKTFPEVKIPGAIRTPVSYGLDECIISAYSSRNREMIDVLKKYNLSPQDFECSDTKLSTNFPAKSEPCNCPKVPCKLNCGAKIPQCLEEDHWEVCLNKEVTCPVPECRKKMSYSKITTHLQKECEYVFCKDCCDSSQLFTREGHRKHWEQTHQRIQQTKCQFCGQLIPSSVSSDYYYDRVLILKDNHTLNHFSECSGLFLCCPNCGCSVPYRLWKYHKCTRIGSSPPRTYF